MAQHYAFSSDKHMPPSSMPRSGPRERLTFLADDDEANDLNTTYPCTSFTDGTCFRNVAQLADIGALLGRPGGRVVLDTSIYQHWVIEKPPRDAEVAVRVGRTGYPIDLADIQDALETVPKDCFQPGRSYMWEGLSLSRSKKTAYVHWGS